MADVTEINRITGAVEDAVTYPILTKEVDGYQGGGRNGESPASFGGSSTRTAQETIRQVLGWRYRGQDTKGFLAALNRAFDLREVEGHTEWEWKPQNYMIQADLGEITGAQASILTRAKVVVEHALPILEGLTPLRDDANDDAMESVRSIIRNALNELLREFGATRGPRVQRVEDYFDQLLGTNPDPRSPETVGGYLGVLRERFGLDRGRVNTIAEEHNLTNSLILVDYVITLQQTWDANRRYFDRLRKAEPFLGTQLVLLSQMLETVAESVREAYDAMDSVFFSAVERQTTDISLVGPDGKQLSPMTIAELMGWVEDFATAEARQLIQDAGKDGVVAARRTLRQLKMLVTAARKKSEEAGNGARGFHSSRVRRALQELETQLVKAYQLAADVRPAVLASVDPEEVRVDTDDRTNITLIGDGLSQDGKVTLIGPGPTNQRIEATSTTAITSRRLLAQFDLGGKNVVTGSWDVEFSPEDGPSVALADALTIVVAAPIINEVIVTSGAAGGNISLRIIGEAFRQDAEVALSPVNNDPDIDATNEATIDSETIEAEFVANVAAGIYTVIVKNPDKQTDESEEFEIKVAEAPDITSVSSSNPHAVDNVKITIRGSHFNVSTVTLKKDVALITGDITNSTPTKVVAEFDLSGAETDIWTLELMNKDGQSATGEYEIKAFPPFIDTLDPKEGKLGSNPLPVTILGKNFHDSAKIDFGTNIDVIDLTVNDEKTLTATINITGQAARGKRNVTVTNKVDGQTMSKKLAFNITN